MKTLLFVLASLAYCVANPVSSNGKAEKIKMFAEIADKVNSGQNGWVATTDHELTYQIHKTWSQSYCDHSKSKKSPPKMLTMSEEEEVTKLPKSFDARDKWPKCKSIGHIRDQSECGACWAFGSTEAMTDRICIASEGKINPDLSAAHLTACDKKDSNCHGGYLDTAYTFYEKEGIVSGGDFNSKEGCWPYPYNCNGVKNKTDPSCPPHDGFLPDIKCVNECPNKEYKQHSFDEDRHFGQHFQNLHNESEIMLSIYKYGPVSAGFHVYSDFMGYKHGVYEPAKDAHVQGAHAIKVLGWGEEDSKKYWLIANSWSPRWGEKGFVKIKKGTCNLESMVTASLPKLK